MLGWIRRATAFIESNRILSSVVGGVLLAAITGAATHGFGLLTTDAPSTSWSVTGNTACIDTASVAEEIGLGQRVNAEVRSFASFSGGQLPLVGFKTLGDLLDDLGENIPQTGAPATEAEHLRDMVAGLEGARARLDSMRERYLAGDAEAADAELTEATREYSRFTLAARRAGIEECADLHWMEFATLPDGRQSARITIGDPGEPPVVIEATAFTCTGRIATIVGSNGPDTITGTRGDDVIVALGENDAVDGGPGSDLICLGDGDDRATGGAGDDALVGEGGGDVIVGGGGDDIGLGGDGTDRVTLGAGVDVAEGGSGNDSLAGGPDPDRLTGGDGDDTISGDDGWDTVLGGGGRDTLGGGEGADRVFGQDGADTIQGGAEDDVVLGGPEPDTIGGGAGTDRLRGGGGNDHISGGADGDVLFGESGYDVLIGDAGADLGSGGPGIDTCDTEGIRGCEPVSLDATGGRQGWLATILACVLCVAAGGWVARGLLAGRASPRGPQRHPG